MKVTAELTWSNGFKNKMVMVGGEAGTRNDVYVSLDNYIKTLRNVISYKVIK